MEAENVEFIASDEPTTEVINFNVNDAAIAKAKEEFKDIDAYQDIDAAKEAKKVLTKMRTTLGEAHKEQKAGALAYGRKLDTEKNRLLAGINEIEDPISNQLTDIKNASAMAEEKRIAAIMSHIERLQSYSLDRHDLSVEQIKERRTNLATETFEEERYQEHLNDAKMAAEEADTKLRIVLQRELDADEERAKQAKIAEENAAATAELDKRQAEMDARDAEQKKADQVKEDARIATVNAENAERQAGLDKQAEELAAKQKVIDDAEAEKKREAAAEENRLAEMAKAPDRDKLEMFCRNIDHLVDNKPTMESQEGANTMLFAVGELITIAKTVRECVEEMK